jgi:hypothetical protein
MRLPAFLAVPALLLLARVASPQGTLPRPLPVASVAASESGSTAGVHEKRDDRETHSIVARGHPRSYQVVAVDVPAALPADRPVSFVVHASGGVPVLGRREGTLDPSPVGTRAVVLTLGVPSKALAGRRPAAVVSFSAAGFSNVDIPIELDVAPVRGLTIADGQSLRGARPGDAVLLTYRLTNTGNAPDSLTLSVEAPDGWRARGGGRVTLGVGSTVEHRVKVFIPMSASSGPAGVRIVAADGATVRGRALTTIEVVRMGDGDEGAAPTLTTGVASVVAGTRDPQQALAIGLSGPLTSSVQVQGQLTAAGRLDGTNARSLARVGYFPSANYLSLSSPLWHLSLGIAGLSVSDLAGTNVWGEGAAFQYSGARWRTTSIIAQPTSGQGDGELVAGQVAHKIGSTWVTTSASHLRDAQGGLRELDALAFGAQLPSRALGSFSAELAGRRYAGGSGLGWTTELKRDAERGSVQLRVTHAPGGGAAFARAVNEYTGNISRTITKRMSVSASGWTADDENSTFSTLGSRGWSIAPQYQLSRSTTVQLEARSSSFDATSATGRFGSAQTAASLRLNYSRGVLFASADGSFGSLDRIARPATGGRFDTSAPHSSLRGTIGYSARRGRFDLMGSLEQTGADAGITPRQSVISLQAERVQPFASHPWLSVNGELQRFGWFGDRAELYMLRTGVEADVGRGFRVVFDVERNALFRSVTDAGSWTAVVKVERATSLAPLTRARTTGVVYQDLNANGQRDFEEPGFAGAVVRRDGQVAVTDRRGRYRLSGDGREAQLDARSLPPGWMTAGASTTASTAGEFGVLPTAMLEVRLHVAPDAQGRAASVSLGPASVIARDSAGRSWLARATEGGVASFDALPLGTYTIEVEIPSPSEPLLLPSPLPAVTLTTPRGIGRVAVPLGVRPLKIWRPRAPEQSSSAEPAAVPLPAAATTSETSQATTGTAGGGSPVAELSASREVRAPSAAVVLPSQAGDYIVRPHDTLSSLAARFLHDEVQWPLLYDANRATLQNPDSLDVGQRLRIVGFRSPVTEWRPDSSSLFGQRVRLTPKP